MPHRARLLSTALPLLAAAGLRAQDVPAPAPIDNAGNAPGSQPAGGPELAPGSRFPVNSPRQVQIRGLIDLDALIQGNYLSGNNSDSDHRGYGLIRTALGTKVKLDERVAAIITLGYYDEAGSAASNTGSSTTTTTNPLPTVPRDRGRVVLQDGFVEFKQFLGFTELGVDAGRMPVQMNLRRDKGAFLYDSRANDPAVPSWDGARASYDLDTGSSNVVLTPYAYRLPDNSSLFGGMVDWKPLENGSSRTFITGSFNLERNVVLRPVAGDPTPGIGRRLITYYGGAEFELNEFDIYGEYAAQRGEQTSTVQFKGWGANAGMEWKTHLASGQQFVLGVKGDYLSGDNNPNDSRNYAFINNWEGVSDTYIVESEKYGELSRYVQGNLEDVKGTAGIAFDDHNRLRLTATYGYYRIPTPMPGAPQNFGQEGDLTLTWQYTYNATFRLFGAVFKPFSGFDQVAPVGPALASTDPIYLMGLNLNVLF
jgi:hypothetical protein